MERASFVAGATTNSEQCNGQATRQCECGGSDCSAAGRRQKQEPTGPDSIRGDSGKLGRKALIAISLARRQGSRASSGGLRFTKYAYVDTVLDVGTK